MTTIYRVGTATVANGGTTVTGTDTFWAGKVFEGDLFTDPAQGLFARVTADATSNTSLSINAWPGTGLTADPYEVILQADSIRMSERARQLLEALTLVEPNFDAQVANLAARAAYDGELGPSGGERGFAVLVSNVGDGRSAIYSKLSNVSADWSAPAYFTGPVGPASTVPGVVWRGPYAGGTLYAINDGVTFNGSSFRKLTTAAAGTAPSSASPPVNTVAWEVLAAKGLNGTGTGDVVGPATSTVGRLAIYADTTGKLIGQTGALTADQQSRARNDLGLNVLSINRDPIVNGQFEVVQRNLPVAIATFGVGIDCWRVVTLAGITASVNRAALPVGDARGKYFMQVAFAGTGVSGSTISQRMAGVDTHAGKKATLAFSAADNAATAGVVQIRQFFGTGGSPSAPVASNTAITLSPFLSTFKIILDVPPVSGKTLGTNGGDYLEIIWIPTIANAHTFSLGNVRFDEGDTTNEVDLPVRSFQHQEELCKWFYEVKDIGANSIIAVAQAYSTTTCLWEFDYTRKRIAPSILVPTNLVPLSAIGVPQTVSSHTPTGVGTGSARVTTVIAAASLVAGNATAILTTAGARIEISAEYT